MEDDRAAEAVECFRRRLVGRSRVDDDRLPELLCQGELPLEELELRVVRRVVPVEVEARLAQRNGSVVAEELPELWEVVRLLAPGLMWVD